MRPLYRAVAYIYGSREPEVHVFFEGSRDDAVPLLARTWGVSVNDVEVYNVCSERDLLDQSLGHEDTGDARLLEVGGGGDDPIHYARPEVTLLLVRPRTLGRLQAAQLLAASLLIEHRTPEGQRRLVRHWSALRRAQQQPQAVAS